MATHVGRRLKYHLFQSPNSDGGNLKLLAYNYLTLLLGKVVGNVRPSFDVRRSLGLVKDEGRRKMSALESTQQTSAKRPARLRATWQGIFSLFSAYSGGGVGELGVGSRDWLLVEKKNISPPVSPPVSVFWNSVRPRARGQSSSAD